MAKDKSIKRILWSIGLTLGLVLSLTIAGLSTSAHADSSNGGNANAYDISEYQGTVNDNQASQLKNEVNFMILKAQNGGLYTDPQFNHNASEMESHNVPYGVYDYSLYANPAQAQSEAQALYQRAPRAKFYVNDSEENDAGNQLDASTQAWANEIHQLTKKPAVLYSDMSFMNNFTPQTRKAYDALWVAGYGQEPNTPYHYDLWQATDSHYSPALRQSVDASVFPDNNDKPLSFWTGDGRSNKVVKPTSHRNRKRSHGKSTVRLRRHRKNNRKQNVNRKKKSKRVNRRSRQNKSRRSRVKKHVRKSHRNSSKKSIKYNLNYYNSNQIHYLKVISPFGIRLENMNGRCEDGVAPGTVLNVYGFKPFYNRKEGHYTKAIGMHFGKSDLFTARKDLVQRV